jgi:hypothetical protein
MIAINNISISDNGLNLNVNVQTGVGFKITSMNLWTEDDYKDYSKKKPIVQVQGISNKEIFIASAASLGISSFNGIYFLEIKSNEPEPNICETCTQTKLVVVTNMNQYYSCITEMVLESDLCSSNFFSTESCDENNINKAMTASLLMDTITQCLELGQVIEAIDLLKKLKRVCIKCNSCKSIQVSNNCSTCRSYEIT